MPFTLPVLPYTYNALEPYLDAQTMEIHHTKHHQAYINNLNAALENNPAATLSIEEIQKQISQHTPAVRNNAGGHYNHTLFWSILTPNTNQTPNGKIAEAINQNFGSFDNFKAEFTKAATTRFGSGWAWLCLKPNKTLCVCSTPNQDNPLMDIAECPGTPLLGIDVWEHAYYLKYQNRRPEYIENFFKIINWEQVNKNYEQNL